jgi:hypothetical protein
MRAFLVFAALGAALILAPVAQAQTSNAPPQVFIQFKPDDLAGILKDAGYRAEMVHENGRYRIRTGMGGRRVTLYLYCDDSGNCQSVTWELSFSASPDFTVTLCNKWNRDRRYAKAYIDTDGGIVVQYDVAFAGGVTKENVAESARLFERVVGVFDSVINAN